MAERSFRFRITSEGLAELEQKLKALGPAGEDAFNRLKQASPQLANALKAAEEHADRARTKIEALGKDTPAGLRALGQAANDVGGSLQGMAMRLGPLGAALTALGPIGIGVGVALAGLAAGTAHAIKSADELVEASERVGMSAENFQTWSFSAKQSGVSVNDLTSALDRLNRAIADVAQGDGPAETFKRLGVSVAFADGQLRNSNDVLRDVAKSVSAIEDPAKRTQAAMELFGKGGGQLINVLLSTGEHFDEAAAKAREFGVVIDGELLKKGAEASDQIDVLGSVISAQFTTAFIELAPLVTDAAEALSVFFATVGKGYKTLQSLFADDEENIIQDISIKTERLAQARVNLANPPDYLRGNLKALQAEADQLEADINGLVSRHAKMLGDAQSAQAKAAAPAKSLAPVIPKREIEEATKAAKEHQDAVDAMYESARKAAQEERDAKAKAIGTVDSYISSLQEERYALGLSDRDAEIYRAGQRAEADLRKANIDLMGDEARERMDSARIAAGNLYDSRKAKAEQDNVEKARLDAIRDAEKERQRLVEHTSDEIADHLVDVFDKAGDESGKQIAERIKSWLKRTAFQAMVDVAVKPYLMQGVGTVANAVLGAPSTTASFGNFLGGAQNSGSAIAAQSGSSYAGASPLSAASTGYTIGTGGQGGISSFGGSLYSSADAFSATNFGGSISQSSFATMQANGQIASTFVTETGQTMAITSTGETIPVSSGTGTLGTTMQSAGTLAAIYTGGRILGAEMAKWIGADPKMAGQWGGFVGAVPGALISKFFGGGGQPKEGRVPGSAATSVDVVDGKFVVGGAQYSTGDGGGPELLSQLRGAVEHLASGLNQAATELGLTITESASGFAALGAGWLGNPNHQSDLQRVAGSASNVFTDSQTAALAILRNPALFEGGGLVRTAMANSDATTLEEFGTEVEFARNLQRSLESLDPSFSTLEKQLQALKDVAEDSAMTGLKPLLDALEQAKKLGLESDWRQFAEGSIRKQFQDVVAPETLTESEQLKAQTQGALAGLKEVVARLGLGITDAEIAGFETQAFAKLKDGFDDQVADDLLAMLDPGQLVMRQFDKWEESFRREAEAIGANMVEVEKLIAERRKKAVEESASELVTAQKKATEDWKAWLYGQQLGNTSSLTGTQKLSAAQAEFATVEASAKANDPAALARVTGVANDVLAAAREVYASGVDFTLLEQSMRSRISELGKGLGLPGFWSGGSFTVGGWGGQDSTVVRFRATPGEQVTVNRPDQRGGDMREIGILLAELVAEMRQMRREMGGTTDGLDRLVGQLKRQFAA